MAKISKKVSKADELKAFKAAKTTKEMVESWGLKLGGEADMFHEIYKVYEEKAPHLGTVKTCVSSAIKAQLSNRYFIPLTSSCQAPSSFGCA